MTSGLPIEWNIIFAGVGCYGGFLSANEEARFLEWVANLFAAAIRCLAILPASSRFL